MSARSTAAGSLGALAFVSALVLFPAAPAFAEIPSELAFPDTTAVTADFGSDWVIPITIRGMVNEASGTAPLAPEDGTVNVTLSGIGGVYATALPIQPGGLVYFAQPTDQPVLAPGTYQVSANFVPAGGSYYDASVTYTPLQLTISAVAVTPRVSAEYEPGVKTPVISASLGGAYVEQNGGAPAGTWHFDVVDQHGTSAFDSEVAQKAGASDPIRIEITSQLSSGYDYTVSATFLPVVEFSSGITVDPIPQATFTAPSGSLLEILAGAAPLPLRLAIPLGILILALAITTLVLAIKVRGRIPASPPKSKNSIPGDPDDVEIVDMEFVGIRPQQDGSANWSLTADDESSASEPDTGDAGTAGAGTAGAGDSEQLNKP